jgi:hypothetical protein
VLKVLQSDDAHNILAGYNNFNQNKATETKDTIDLSIFNLKQVFYRPNINTAVFGVLPPEKSGIANYNAKTYSLSNHFHVYSEFTKNEHFNEAIHDLGEDYKNNFFHIDIFPKANSLFNYKKYIYVLGNSYHNVPYLKAAIDENDKNKCFLYCHEINSHNLLHNSLTFDDYKQILITTYPELFQVNFDTNSLTFEDIKGIVNYGFRAILLLTKTTNVIVNNDKAKQLILSDVKDTIFENNISITTAFLPFTKRKSNTGFNSVNIEFDGLKIGLFGVCSKKEKSTDIIMEAVALLNEKYGINSKCIFAGYDVDKYIQAEVPSDLYKYLLCFPDNSEDQLFSLMSQVDIAVQLRNYPHGETSGVVCQLLALNKKIIVSDNFIDERFENYCTIVPRFISSNELAKVILDTVNNNINIDASSLFNKFGFNNLVDTILNI